MAVRVNAFSHPERRPGQIRIEPNPSISCFESRQWWRHASRVTCRAFPSAVLHSSPRFSERQYARPQAVRFAAKHSRRASRHVAEGATTQRPG